MRLRASLALLGLAIAAWAQVPPPSEGTASPVALSATTPEGAGRAVADLLQRKAPGVFRGRVALGWSPQGNPLAEGFSRSLARSSPAFLPLADLGVRAESLAEALAQLDSGTFSGLFWVEAHLGAGGELAGASLLHKPLAEGEAVRIEVVFDPPVGGGPRPAAGPETLYSESLPPLDGRVVAALLDGDGVRFWYLTEGTLAQRALWASADLQRWALGEGDAQPPSPGVLRSAGGPGGDRRVGWSAGGKGLWFVSGTGGWGRGGALEGFPLTEREARFLQAPWLGEEGLYALLNHQGEELAKFREMVRIRDASGESLLVLLGGDGTIKALGGNTLQAAPAPAEGSFGALAGSGDLVALTERGDTPALRIFRAGAGTLWEEPWRSFPLPAPATAVAVGMLQGNPAFLVFLSRGESTEVLLLRPGASSGSTGYPGAPAAPEKVGGGPEASPGESPKVP